MNIELTTYEVDELKGLVEDSITRVGEAIDKTQIDCVAEALENRRFRLKDILEKLKLLSHEIR